MNVMSQFTLMLTLQPNNYNLQKIQFLIMAVLVIVIVITSMLIVALSVSLFRHPAGRGKHAQAAHHRLLKPVSVVLAAGLLAALLFHFF